MTEIQNLNKQINFNSLIYYFENKSAPKNVLGFKGLLSFFLTI